FIAVVFNSIVDREAGDRDFHPFPTRRSSDLEQIVRIGTVTGVRPITIQDDKSSGVGMVAGGALGGAVALSAFVALTLTPMMSSKDRKSTRLNSSHVKISYAFFCFIKKQIFTD